MQSFDRHGTCVGFCGPPEDRIVIASVGHGDNRTNGFPKVPPSQVSVTIDADDRRSLVGAARQAMRTAAPMTSESNGLTMYFV